MAGEEEYYSPIIQAMVATSQKQQHQADLAEKTRSAKAEENYRQLQLTQAKSIADRNFELDQQRLANEGKVTEANIEANHIASIPHILDFIKQGGNPDELHKSGVSFMPSNLPSQQDLLNNEINRIRGQASAQSGGVAEGEAPFKQAEAARQFDYTKQLEGIKFGNQKELEQAKADNEFAKTKFIQSSAEKMAQLERSTQLSIAGMNNNTQMQRTAAEYGITPEESMARTYGIFTGQIKPTNNPIDRRIEDNGVARGFKLPGKDVDELKALDNLTPVLQEFQDFANKSPSTRVGAKLQSANAAIGGSEAKASYDTIMSHVQQIELGLEGFTGATQRLAKGFQAGSNLIPQLGDTQANNQKRVDNIKKQVEDRKNEILKDYNPQQREMILKQAGLTPPTGGGSPTPTGPTHRYNPTSGAIEPIQ